MRKKQEVKFFIKEKTLRQVGSHEFSKIQKQEALENCVPQSDLIKRKVFTRSEIDNLVDQRCLTPVVYKNKVYFDKYRVREIILRPPVLEL